MKQSEGRIARLQFPRVTGDRLRSLALQLALSLLLSLALWTFVSFTVNPTTRTAVPVEIAVIEPREGLILVDLATGVPINPDLDIELEVVGPQLDINRLDPDQFQAQVDLSNLDAGLHTVPIIVSGPRNLRINSTNPSTIDVRLEPEERRTFDVTVRKLNTTPFLFQERDSIASAEQVVASGPAEYMNRVAEVIAPVNLSGRTTAFTEEVQLVAVDSNGDTVPGITLSPATTNISVTIQPRVDIQRIAVVPRFINQPAPGYTTEDIDWNPKYVDVIASVQVTGTLETEPIDLAGRTESFTQTVRLVNPDQTITRLLTDTVTVSVPIVPFQIPTNYSLFVPVTPINVAPGLQSTAQPPSLTITVSGTFDQLRQLANATVQATVDMSDRGPGTYTLPVQIDLPSGLQIVGERPQVTVTLAEGASPAPEGG